MRFNLYYTTILVLALSGCASQTEQDKDYSARQHIEAGKTYLKYDKFKKAEKQFKKAVDLDSENDIP